MSELMETRGTFVGRYEVAEFLNQSGREGWRLCAVFPRGNHRYSVQLLRDNENPKQYEYECPTFHSLFIPSLSLTRAYEEGWELAATLSEESSIVAYFVREKK